MSPCYDPFLGREAMVTTYMEFFVSFLQCFLGESGGCISGGRVSSLSVFEGKFVGLNVTQLPTSISIFIDAKYRLNIDVGCYG